MIALNTSITESVKVWSTEPLLGSDTVIGHVELESCALSYHFAKSTGLRDLVFHLSDEQDVFDFVLQSGWALAGEAGFEPLHFVPCEDGRGYKAALPEEFTGEIEDVDWDIRVKLTVKGPQAH